MKQFIPLKGKRQILASLSLIYSLASNRSEHISWLKERVLLMVVHGAGDWELARSKVCLLATSILRPTSLA